MYKRTLNNFDFSKLKNILDLEDKELRKKELEYVRSEFSWLFPQLMAFFNTIKLHRNATGKIGFTETLQGIKEDIDKGVLRIDDYVVTVERFVTMLRLIKYSNRSELLHSRVRQFSKEGIRWSVAVPLFCSAFKEYRNLAYSEWDWSDPKVSAVVDPEFAAYAKYFGKELPFTQDELLELREKVLVYKSGAKMGQRRNPDSTAVVYSTGNSEFDKLPSRLRLSLLQLWVFSPHLHHSLTIVNHMDLDSPAVPLVQVEVSKPSSDTADYVKEIFDL